MVDVDRQTDEAIEMVSQGARLTTNLINYIFKSLADRLEKGEKDALVNSQSKEGKQKINNLLRKHKDGIQTLDENLTKEQVKDYQKELKKLGVDFSIVKNGKDNYSFFFAGGQSGVIEKALKNVVELKSKVMNNEKVKDAQMDLDSEMNNFSEKEIETVNKAYGKYLSNKENEDKIPERESLTDKEKVLFDKIKKLDETEKEVTEEIRSAEAEKEEHSKDETSLDVSEANDKVKGNTKEQSKAALNEKISELSNEELNLFEKRMEYENVATAPSFNASETYRLADELKDLQKGHSKDTINKVNNLDKGFRNPNNFSEVSKGNKLNANEILRQTKKHSSERNNQNKKEFSVSNVKVMDRKIREESKDKDKAKKKEHEQSR